MMSLNDKKQLHIIVQGQVQGVGFRYFVMENANNIGVTGWVRNTLKGDVEVLVEGTDEQLEKFSEIVKHGPRLAFISNTELQWNPASGEFVGFSLRNTI